MTTTMISDEVIALTQNIYDLYKVAIHRSIDDLLETEPSHEMKEASSLNAFYSWRGVLRYQMKQDKDIHLPWNQGEKPTLSLLSKEIMSSSASDRSTSLFTVDLLVGRPLQSEILANMREAELGSVSDVEYHGRTMLSYQMLYLMALPASYILTTFFKGLKNHQVNGMVPLDDMEPYVYLARVFSTLDSEIGSFFRKVYRKESPLSVKSTYNRIRSYENSGYDVNTKAVANMASARISAPVAREHDFTKHINDWYDAGADEYEVYLWLMSPEFRNYPEVIVNWIREGLTAETAGKWFKRGIDNSKDAGIANRATPNSWADSWD